MSDLDDLRASQDRDLRRIGVPMLLALSDETGAAVPVGSPDGERVAGDLDHLRAALAPSQRDGDLGVVATLLSVAAYRDFGASAGADPRDLA